MLKVVFAIVSLIYLFFVLNKTAGLIINNLQIAAAKTRTSPILIGIALGFFTTIPEIAVGFNAIYTGISAISLGNIWGGIFLLFTLALGLAVFFNKQIKNDGKLTFVLLSFVFIILSIALAYKGQLNWLDGLIILAFYFLLIYFKFQQKDLDTEKKPNKLQLFYLKVKEKLHLWSKSCLKELRLVLISVIFMLVASSLIVSMTNFLLSYFSVPPFLIGLLVFSIGTNLPELSIVIRAIFSKSGGSLSFSYLIGSAINSTAALGLLALFHTFSVEINWSFIILSIILSLVLLVVAIFYITQKALDRWEGAVLLAIYFFFVFYQILTQV